MRDKRVLALAAVLALTAVLRFWGPLGDPSVQHPDEYFLVYGTLHLFSGDFNHQHTLTSSYPGQHYYLLAALYLFYFAVLKIGGLDWSMDQWVAYHFVWDGDPLVQVGRWLAFFFALVTVWWAGCLGRRVWGETAGWLASLSTAVCVLHVRHSGLVAVDIPMTCWYVGAVWAAVRLLHRERLRAYLLAGAFVGLAAGAKYPGALAGSAVAVAHMSAGRGLLDRRLWASGMAAVAAFFAATPYTLMDFATFSEHFAALSYNLEHGHGRDLGVGWYYHLHETLPNGLGWLGLALAAYGAFLAGKDQQGRVLLAAFAGFYLVMGSGQLVFVRYALPLLVLASVLMAGGVAGVRTPGRYVLLLAVLLEPIYGSAQVMRLQANGDTRSAARQWAEATLPSGSTCCNFGGWSGDVPLRTIEGLWTRIRHYRRLWGAEQLQMVEAFLLQTGPSGPFYSYAIHHGNRRQEAGDMAVVRQSGCSYAIVHRHPLHYSTIDTAFARALSQDGERLVGFSPGDVAAARYDPIDAYFLPTAGFHGLEKTGPEIEIWRVGPDAAPSWSALPGALAQAYARGAASFLQEGDIAAALAMVKRGLALDGACIDGYLVSAYIMEETGRDRYAVGFYERAVALAPARVDSWLAMGNAYRRLGENEEARRCYDRVLALAPEHPGAAALREVIGVGG